MTTHNEIENRLLRALSFEPSADDLQWLDQRVAGITARPAAAARLGAQGLRLFLRPLALIAAFVLLTGAVAAGLSLLDRVIESSGAPGWHIAYERAERLDLTATDGGVTITLERAYADLNQLLVGFTVVGLEVPTTGAEEPAALQWVVDIRDPSGRGSEEWATSQSGMGMDETGLSAVVQTWEGAVAPAAGTWVLTFSSVGYNGGGFVPGQCTVGATDPECLNSPPNAMVNGTWEFEFSLPAPAGTLFSADASDTIGQATLTLTDLRVSPTMLTATIALRVADEAILDWGSIGATVQHDGTSYRFQSGYHVTQDPDQQGPNGDVNELMTVAGSDEEGGTWELTIPELTYRLSKGEEVEVSGPWTLTVIVP
ncbi:MAG: DUF4179 domain-containing protein [Chloroflexota bacterium]